MKITKLISKGGIIKNNINLSLKKNKILPYTRTNICLIDTKNSLAILENLYIDDKENNPVYSINTNENFNIDKILISNENGGLDINNITINDEKYIKDNYINTLFVKYNETETNIIIPDLESYQNYKNNILKRTILINFIGLFITYFIFYKLIIAYIVGSVCGIVYLKSLQYSIDSNIFFVSFTRYIIFIGFAFSIIDNDINNLIIFFIAFSINKLAIISISNDKTLKL